MCLYPSSQFIYLVFSCSFIFPFIYSFIVHLTATVLYAVYWVPQIKDKEVLALTCGFCPVIGGIVSESDI